MINSGNLILIKTKIENLRNLIQRRDSVCSAVPSPQTKLYTLIMLVVDVNEYD